MNNDGKKIYIAAERCVNIKHLGVFHGGRECLSSPCVGAVIWDSCRAGRRALVLIAFRGSAAAYAAAAAAATAATNAAAAAAPTGDTSAQG